MIAGITVIFGMDLSKSFLTSFVSSAIGASGTTILGKMVASNLLKLVPGVGTVTGGAISGATASVLTTALGLTYIQIMEMIYKGEMSKEALETKEGRKKMVDLFKHQLKKIKLK